MVKGFRNPELAIPRHMRKTIPCVATDAVRFRSTLLHPNGQSSDLRFISVPEKVFCKCRPPPDGVMRLTAAEVAFVELAVSL